MHCITRRPSEFESSRFWRRVKPKNSNCFLASCPASFKYSIRTEVSCYNRHDNELSLLWAYAIHTANNVALHLRLVTSPHESFFRMGRHETSNLQILLIIYIQYIRMWVRQNFNHVLMHNSRTYLSVKNTRHCLCLNC